LPWSCNTNGKKTNVFITFSEPITLLNFSFALYSYSRSIGILNGWKVYYKNDDNNWINVISAGSVNTGGNMAVVGANNKMTRGTEYNKNKSTLYGHAVSKNGYSKEWKFELNPSKKIHIYFIRMYGTLYEIKKNDSKIK